MRFWLTLIPLAAAIAQPPTFTAGRVLPSGSSRPAKLTPGMLTSIYGEHLGPAQPCTSTMDPATLAYPTELCGVRVLLAGRAAGLLYASEKQINFQVPPDSLTDGEAELKVITRGGSHSVKLPAGRETTSLSLDVPARVGGPVWLRIDPPARWGDTVRYPVQIEPWNFGCHDIEVSRNGQLLPRIAIRLNGPRVFVGLPCGTIGVPGNSATHTGRLPIHLLYRFDRPGIYEVRYTFRNMPGPQGTPVNTALRSDWTPIHILPTAGETRAARPMPHDPADILADYLPGLLSAPNSAAWNAVVECLYHPEQTVRSYAAAALGYWPESEVRLRLSQIYATRGPSDVVVAAALSTAPGLLERAAPYLQSTDPVLLRGAVAAARELLRQRPSPAMESALLAAAGHIERTADPQTLVDYTAVLGGVKDHRASALLWDFVDRRVSEGQALIAITWRKDPADLARLSAALEGSPRSDEHSRDAASLPYAMRNSYGEAALPYLETALRNSHYVWVRLNCAEELILAGRRAGFLFAADAIAHNQPYKLELLQFLRDRFPETRGAPESQVLDFLERR